MKPYLRYLTLLFGDWINLVSVGLTLLSLLAGLLEDTALPGLLQTLPRSIFVLIAFMSFAYANFRINSRFTESTFEMEFAGVVDLSLVKGGFEFADTHVKLEKDLTIKLTADLLVSNKVAARSIHFFIATIDPDGLLACEPSDLKVQIRRKASGIWLENPYHFNADEMYRDFQIVIDLPFSVPKVESTFGSLSQFRCAEVSVAALQPEGSIMTQSISIDLTPIHHRLEDIISSKMQHLQNSRIPAKEMLLAIKRYYGVETRSAIAGLAH